MVTRLRSEFDQLFVRNIMPKLTCSAIDAEATRSLVACISHTLQHCRGSPPPLPSHLIGRTAVTVHLDALNTLINRRSQVSPIALAVLSRPAARVLPLGTLGDAHIQQLPGLQQALHFATRFLPESRTAGVHCQILTVEFQSDFVADNFRDTDELLDLPVCNIEQWAQALQSFCPRSFTDECSLRPCTPCYNQTHRHNLAACPDSMRRVSQAVIDACPPDAMARMTQAAAQAWQGECKDLSFGNTPIDQSLQHVLGHHIARAVLRSGKINHT